MQDAAAIPPMPIATQPMGTPFAIWGSNMGVSM